MSWTIVISHSPVQVRVGFDTIFNQCVALFASPFRSKNIRSIAGEEIEKTKQPYPDPHNHPYDFYISCPFCNKGVMEPPELVSFGDAFEDFTEE
jgi:hypothetical protein